MTTSAFWATQENLAPFRQFQQMLAASFELGRKKYGVGPKNRDQQFTD